MKRRWSLIALLPHVMCIACGPNNWVEYAPTGEGPLTRAPRPESAVEVYIDPAKPTRPFQVVALVTIRLAEGHGAEQGMGAALRAIRTRVASEGIDGIMVLCGDPGTVGQDRCAGKAFVYTP
jgi:hypothetical protein